MQTKIINISHQQQKNNLNSEINKQRQEIEEHLNTIESQSSSAQHYIIELKSPALPPYRMPPTPEAALPGAPAPSATHALHTHSAKFPIEREVILSSGEKSSKVPILMESRKKGRLTAVAPDTPPKTLSAWTHAENHQAGPSVDYRPQYHEHYGYNTANQGAVPRNYYDQSAKPPVPNKSTYNQNAEQNNQSITVTVETGKDITKDAPKSTKSVSKTYHTLKDMISNRFKSKDSSEDNEASLNNSEEKKKEEGNIPNAGTPVTRVNDQREAIYGRPIQQNRPEGIYGHQVASSNYSTPSPHRQLMQQQIMHQQMLLKQQARSQEMLNSAMTNRSMALGADAVYQQFAHPAAISRNSLYHREMDNRNMANFTSLKQTSAQATMQQDNSHLRSQMRRPPQLEREDVRHQGLIVGRRAASHPHLLDEPRTRPEVVTPQIHDKPRRSSHGNLLDANENIDNRRDERESDEGGFRGSRNNIVESNSRSSGRSMESYRAEPTRVQENTYRRTPDDYKGQIIAKDEGRGIERNEENTSQKSLDSVYNSTCRQTPNRIDDLKSHGKKSAGSGASSDYDKNGGQSSNVDSGRGSVAYSSGRRPNVGLHDTSADSDALAPPRPQPQPGTAQQNTVPNVDNEWADIVECELRQILEPKLAGMRIDSSGSSVSSVTPPLPPTSPSSDVHKRNSLPTRPSEYPEDRRRGRESPRWYGHKKHTSKREHHYKKHLFGLDTTDMTSTTTRSLDLSSILDGRSDSEASTGERAIRRQLRGLENMYAEVLQLLGVRKTTTLGKQPTFDARMCSKRRYGSMSSLPSSSVSSRPVRDKRRSSDHRKKYDMKGINKRFQRLESHVVTLARSVAHLSSEMRTQHLVIQEMEAVRAEIASLRQMYKCQQYERTAYPNLTEPNSFSHPARVKRLTKFFGDEPPLMRMFLKRLGYEKYASLLEKEKVGAAELPYVGEDRLRALGVPLGPRMRILKEAGIHSEIHMPRDDPHTTTTTLAIV